LPIGSVAGAKTLCRLVDAPVNSLTF
jgi:hypothetical protein